MISESAIFLFKIYLTNDHTSAIMFFLNIVRNIYFVLLFRQLSLSYFLFIVDFFTLNVSLLVFVLLVLIAVISIIVDLAVWKFKTFLIYSKVVSLRARYN